MRKRWNGSVQSNNTPAYNNEGIGRDDYNIYRCMVTQVLYTDDPQNITRNSQNPEVLYEVIILGGNQTGQIISFCRLSALLGGNNSYEERILKPTSKSLSKVKLSQHDGDVVYVQFIQGHSGYPIIVGLAKGINNLNAAKKSEGPRWVSEYNGLKQEINNKGDLTITRKGGSVSNGVFSAKNDPSSQGVIKLEDGSITIDANGVQVFVNGKTKLITMKSGSTEIDVDGNSGKISLKGDFVDIGSSVNDFAVLFTQLLTAFNSHQHIGNLGAPTSPPLAPLLQSVGSQTVKVQP